MASVRKANEPPIIKYTMTLLSQYKMRLSISESQPREDDSA